MTGLVSLTIGIFLAGFFVFNMKAGKAILPHIFAPSAERSRNPRSFWIIQLIVAALALVWLARAGLQLLGLGSP